MTAHLIEGASILLVDDDPTNIKVLANTLKSEGYKLAFAQSGQKALELTGQHIFDLILLDIMMPEMDGYEVAGLLKASPDTKEIPVIFLTGKTQSEDIVKGFDSGAVDYISKPFNGKELISRVRTHLALKKSREEVKKLYQQINDELDEAAEFQAAVMRETIVADFINACVKRFPYGKVSGDILDCVTEENGRIGIFMGDAVGHGISAALITMMIPCILDSIENNDRTCDAISRINDVLTNRQSDGLITGIYTRINPDGLLTTCNAGHPPILILNRDGSATELSEGGLVMGIYPSDDLAPYTEEIHQLNKGDKIYIYTDGLTDREGKDGKPLGIDGLKSLLEKYHTKPLDAVMDKIFDHVNLSDKVEGIADDISVIGIEYTG